MAEEQHGFQGCPVMDGRPCQEAKCRWWMEVSDGEQIIDGNCTVPMLTQALVSLSRGLPRVVEVMLMDKQPQVQLYQAGVAAGKREMEAMLQAVASQQEKPS